MSWRTCDADTDSNLVLEGELLQIAKCHINLMTNGHILLLFPFQGKKNREIEKPRNRESTKSEKMEVATHQTIKEGFCLVW